MTFLQGTVFDISVPISPDLCVWPGDTPIAVSPMTRISDGDAANVSQIICTTHTGTHVDAPWHFVDMGKKLEQIPPTRWVGPCWVAALSDQVQRIEPDDLEAVGIPSGTERLLLRTANSRLWRRQHHFETDYVGISPESARWVVDRGIRLIGIDYLSIEPYGEPGYRTHRTLLENEVLILEGLDLSAVPAGAYQLLCLPLRLAVGDGAPARALLIRP